MIYIQPPHFQHTAQFTVTEWEKEQFILYALHKMADWLSNRSSNEAQTHRLAFRTQKFQNKV